MTSPQTSTLDQSSSTVLLPLVPLNVPVEHSSDVWRCDLRDLFKHAKDRFGDVTWDVGPSAQDEEPRRSGSSEGNDVDESNPRPSVKSHEVDTQEVMETVWGHKAIIYARAPPAFQYRYFPRTPNRSSTPAFRSPSAAFLAVPNPESNPARTSLSLRAPSRNSVYSTASTCRSVPTRIRVGVTPQMFKAELEWLYTGEGMGDVAEWLNQDTSLHVHSGIDGNLEAVGGHFGLGLGLELEQGAVGVDDIQKIEGREIEKRESLRNDLVFMWRSKLYSDVKIVIPCESLPTSSRSSTVKRHSFIDETHSDDSSSSLCAMFSAHKFILASRSPYFASLLLNSSGFQSGEWEETNEIELLSPPFTPASVHFCLGYMYAGTLAFSNRTYDLTTAFEIYRSATYLLMDALRAEVESRIIHEMCDSLSLLRSPGPTKLCARRVPRVWRFAGASDVGAQDLRSRTRAWIVRHWAECWGKEIGDVEEHERKALVNEVAEGLNPQSICSYFRGVSAVKSRTESDLRTTTGLPRGLKQSTWSENLLEMVAEIESRAKEMWIVQFGNIVRSEEFAELLDGKGFGMDLLERLMTDVVNSAASLKGCQHAGKIYQDLMKSILSLVKPDTNELVLSHGSAVRILVENTRAKVLGHLRRRWLQVREHSGFVDLEPWALQEIGDEIGQPVEELIAPPISPFVPPTRAPPKLSSSMSRPASNLKESDSSKSITRSSSTRRLAGNPNSTKPTDTGTFSRSTTINRMAATPRLATIPAKSTPASSVVPKTSSSPRPSSGASSTPRPMSEKTAVSKSASSVSLSGRSVGGSTTSTRSAAVAKSASSSLPRNPPVTSSRTSTVSSSAPSSSRTRLTSSSKSTPASTPNSSVILSSSAITPSLITTSPSTTSVNAISDVDHKSKPLTSEAAVILPSSTSPAQSNASNSSNRSRVSTIRQSPSTTKSLRLSSSTSTNSLSRATATPKTSLNAAQKTPFVSRDRLSSTTSSMSNRSLTGSFRTSSASTSETAITTAGGRSRTTTSPSVRSLTSSSTTTPNKTNLSRQRTHTSPDVPTEAITPAAPGATNPSTRSSVATLSARTPSTPLASSMRRNTSSLRLSTASQEPTKQNSSNKKPVMPTKTIGRSESNLSIKSQSPDVKSVSVISPETIKRSASSQSIKRSDQVLQPQSKQGVRSPLRPKPTQTSTPTTSSILRESSAPIQSPSDLSNPSLQTSAFAKRTRSHPAASFDPPKRLPQSRKQLTLDKFNIHSLATGEAIEPSPGISLHVGIPCIVSIRATGVGSGIRGKKVRCKAWARYIGGLVGREGAWVGVELAEDIDGIQQQEEEEIGCWKGVRYHTADDLRLGDEWESSEKGTPKKRRSLMAVNARDKNLRRRGMFLPTEDVVWIKGA